MCVQKIDKVQATNLAKKWRYGQFTVLQENVLNDCGYKNGAREFIIGATSSGKTLIPLLCYELAKTSCETKKAKLLYMIPYRALATQKEREFKIKFPDDRIIVSTSEYCAEDPNVMHGNCDIAIVIYEKIYMFLALKKNFFRQYTHIVFDELGIVEHQERGLKVDFILNRACLNTLSNIYVLATPYFNWDQYISAYSFRKHFDLSRPVEIKEKVILYKKGELTNEDDGLDEEIFKVCRYHRSMGHKILIFANSRKRVKNLSVKLYYFFRKEEKTREEIREIERNFNSRLFMTSDDMYGIMERENYLAYSEGIAFHNASLPEEVREQVESDFLDDDGKLDIVVSTETLAFGLNSNVDVVLVTDVEKPTGKERKFLTINEYQNYIGRAGRLGKKDIGYAYTFIQKGIQEEKWEQFKSRLHSPDIIESQYKLLKERPEGVFYLLNHFHADNGISLMKVTQNIEKFPYIRSDERLNLHNFTEKLDKRKLIKTYYDELEEEEQIRLTQTGTRAAGYIISLTTYDQFLKNSKWLFEKERIVIFDLIFEMSQCQEMVFSTDYFPLDRAVDYRSHLFAFLKDCLESGVITKGCKNRITNSHYLEMFKTSKVCPKKSAWEELAKIRLTEALFMWMNSYSIEEIKKRCDFDYSFVKKMGEKAKFITDVLAAVIPMTDMSYDPNVQLKKIGVSLFYGIKLEILDRLALTEVEPNQGRQLRTIGRILNLKEHYSKKKAGQLNQLMGYVDGFHDTYKELLEDMTK